MQFIRKLLKRKLLLAVIVVILAGSGYFAYKTFNAQESDARYLTAAVTKGTLVVSISGSGQVSNSNQVEVKPKVSGDIISVGVTNGQEEKAAALIAQLDAREALKAVRDAEANLTSARLSLEKLKQPTDALSLLQTENALAQAKDNLTKLTLSQETDYQKALEAKQKNEADLKKTYEDGYNAVSNGLIALPEVMSGLNDILFSSGDFGRSQQNVDWYLNQASVDNRDKATGYRNDAVNTYYQARAAYTKNLDDYKAVSRTADAEIIESLIAGTYETAKLIADAVNALNNYIDFVQDDMELRNQTIPAAMSAHQASIDSYPGIANGHLASLLSIQTAIRANQETILNSNRDIKEMEQNNPLELAAAKTAIKEKEGSLAKLKSGTDPLDIQSAELTIKQRQNSLLDAREKLADYFVRAPFDGVIAKLDAARGDSASAATALATLITKQKIAEMSLNEVDAAKVKIGQKATLTFDALPDLTLTGQVAEVDAIGAVSQGVVTYAVKIGFDTQDERVKTAMSVSASIITEVKTDVLLVPNSAVKSQGESSYVEMPAETDIAAAATTANGIVLQESLRRQTIAVGSANDELSEVTSGLKENDIIVTRVTQTTGAQSSSARQNSTLRIPGI